MILYRGNAEFLFSCYLDKMQKLNYKPMKKHDFIETMQDGFEMVFMGMSFKLAKDNQPAEGMQVRIENIFRS
jgi:hypothetical protein